MMVKVEAGKYYLEMLVEELEHLNKTIRQNMIHVISSPAIAFAAGVNILKVIPPVSVNRSKKWPGTWR